MNNTKKISRNLVLGIIGEVLLIVLGIIVPRFILTSYGSEINGLLTSVTQIYSYIGLLEAGVGAVTIQALYKHTGNEDRSKINGVLSATNKYYHKTGLFYLLAILIFSCAYPLIVSTKIDTITIILVIVFNGLGNVINYFFQAKYFLLLEAEGKNYIKTTLNMFTNIFKNVAKIVLMAIGVNVVIVQLIAMFVSLIQMIYITWYIKKKYSWIDLSVEPDYGAISQRKNVMVHQISGLVFNNTDTITLTILCGLMWTSVYSMYQLLYGMITTILLVIMSSVTFLLGQTYHQNKDRFMRLYNAYETYYMTLSFVLNTILTFLAIPFIKLYTAGVEDFNYIYSYLPILFASINLISSTRSATNKVEGIEGHFKQTQTRAVIEAVLNLVVSIVLAYFIGIYGVLIGTIVALLYSANISICYANAKILKRKVISTYKNILINLAIFVALYFASQAISLQFNSFINLALFAIPYSIVVFIIYFAIVSLCNIETFKYTFNIIKKPVRNFFGRKK